MDALQEQPGLGALDDAVVVGGGDRHDLRHAELGEGLGVGALERGRVVEAPTPTITPWPGMSRGTDWTVPMVPGLVRVTVAPAKSSGGELVGADLADQVLVGAPEAPEVERVGVADHRHEQGAGAVGLLHVDGEAEADVLVADDARLAVRVLDEGGVHDRASRRRWPARPRSR